MDNKYPLNVTDYSETVRLYTFIIMSILDWIIGTFLLIGFCRFNRAQFRVLMIVQKRYPKIVLIECLLTTIVCMFIGPMLQIEASELSIFKDYEYYISIIVFSMYPTCHIVIGCELARLWLICYDLNYLHASKNSEWSSQINETFSSENWWLANRSKYGNYRYVTRRMALFSISTGLISTILLLLFGWDTWTQLVDSFLFGAPVVLILLLCIIMPNVGDKFLFEIEYRSTAVCFVTGLLIFIIGFIIRLFDPFLGRTVTNCAGIWAFGVVSTISTYWIPHKITKLSWYNQKNSSTKGRGKSPESTREQTESSRSKSTNHIINIIIGQQKENKPQRNVGLKHILANKDALDLFAQHLNSEFSSECILSFIELMQFKKYYNEIIGVNSKWKKNYEALRGIKIKFGFGDTLKSTIVYKTFNFKDCNLWSDSESVKVHKAFKEIAYLLWQKYIKTYATLEINISSRLRAYFWDLMHDKNVWVNEVYMETDDLYNLFDDVCYEMYNLMVHSVARFKISDEFVALQKKLKEKIAIPMDLSPSTKNSVHVLSLCDEIDFQEILEEVNKAPRLDEEIEMPTYAKVISTSTKSPKEKEEEETAAGDPENT